MGKGERLGIQLKLCCSPPSPLPALAPHPHILLCGLIPNRPQTTTGLSSLGLGALVLSHFHSYVCSFTELNRSDRLQCTHTSRCGGYSKEQKGQMSCPHGACGLAGEKQTLSKSAVMPDYGSIRRKHQTGGGERWGAVLEVQSVWPP